MSVPAKLLLGALGLAALAASLLWMSSADVRTPAAPPAAASALPPVPQPAPPRPRPPERVRAAEDPPQAERDDPPVRPSHGAVVRGRLVFERKPAPNLARVALAEIDDERPAEPTRLLVASPATWLYLRTDFAFDVRPGRYLLGVTFRDGTIGASQVIDVAAGDDRPHDLQVPPVAVRDLLVRVLDPEGCSVPDAEVQVGFCEATGGHLNLGITYHADAEGAVRVDHDAPGLPHAGFASDARSFPEDDGRPVRLVRFVLVRSPRFPARRVDYDPQSQDELTVRFTPPALLRVTVDGLLDSPDVDNLHLVLEPATGGRPVGQEYVGDARFEFDAIAPGDYVLRLELDRLDQPLRVVASDKLSLGEGRRDLSWPLPRLVRLAVRFPADALPDVRSLRLERRTSDSAETIPLPRSLAAGALVLTNVRTGRYVLSAFGAETAGEMAFDLESDLDTSWQGVAWNALRVALGNVADARELSEAGLRTGDVLAAIDGEELPTIDAARRAASAAESRPSVKVTVVRDGRRVEAEVEGRCFVGSELWLRPAIR